MKIQITFLIFAILLGSFACIAQQSPLQNDSQIWTSVQVTIPIVKGQDEKKKPFDKLTLNFEAVGRFGRNVTYPVDARIGATLEYRINKYFKIAPGYLYQYAEPVTKVKSFETRLTFAGLFEKKFDKLAFRHRSLFEYKLRNSRNNTQVYRAKFYLSHPVSSKEKELFSVFVSEETYILLSTGERGRNEFFAGITRKLSKTFSTDLFYLNVWNKRGLPQYINGFGVNLKIRID